MTEIPLLPNAARALYDQGDHLGSIAVWREVLRDDPAYFEPEARSFIASFPDSERSHFWTPPQDLYPDPSNIQSVFEFIYDRAIWSEGSGGGSSLENNVVYLSYMQALIERHDLRKIVDLGCGDWRFSRYLNLDGRSYVGFDVVASLVAANTAEFGRPNVEFVHADLCAMGDLPAADLIVCKDVLQHLTNQDVAKILDICRVARFALITNDYHPANAENTTGATRPLDIARPPFNYPARPVCRIGSKVSFLKD